MAQSLAPLLRLNFNVAGVVLDWWCVNSETLFPKTVGGLRGDARVLEGDSCPSPSSPRASFSTWALP